MVTVDTIEGLVNAAIWFHYDVGNDVLCVRLAGKWRTPTVGEETDDGFTLLRDTESNEPVGLVVISWWKRFGAGPVPDSIHELGRLIEPWGEKSRRDLLAAIGGAEVMAIQSFANLSTM